MEYYEICDGPDNDHIYVTFLENNAINTRNTTTTTTTSSSVKTLQQQSSMKMSMSNQDSGRFKRKTKIVSGFFMMGVLTGCVIAGCAVFFTLNSKCSQKTQSTWSSWSVCSVSCGKGNQYRVKQGHETDHFDVKVCAENPCAKGVDDLTFDMAFDSAFLYSKRFLSDNNRVLSNTYSSETKNSASSDHYFRNYKGTTSDVCVKDKEIIYYTVQYDYTIKKMLFEDSLLLEVGLAERNRIDNSIYVGSANVGGWSFTLSRCTNGDKLCIKVYHESKRTLQVPVGEITSGTSVEGEFDVLVNRNKDEFSLYRNGTLFYTFNNVESMVTLCPVFGLYNPSSSESRMQIIRSYNYTKLVDFVT